jgi:hypothetical protein
MSRIFGEMRQLAFVVRDLDVALHWDGSKPIREQLP